MADRSILSAHSTETAAAISDAVSVRVVGATRIVDGDGRVVRCPT